MVAGLELSTVVQLAWWPHLCLFFFELSGGKVSCEAPDFRTLACWYSGVAEVAAGVLQEQPALLLRMAQIVP